MGWGWDGGGQLGHFALGPTLLGAPGRALLLYPVAYLNPGLGPSELVPR